jgi:hypothetical protein
MGGVEDQLIAVKLGGYRQPFNIKFYDNPGDVDLVYICNNEMGRKRFGTVNENDQSFTLAPPHRWNSKDHGNDWYLENALERLDQPGEWHLDRSSTYCGEHTRHSM